MLTASLNKIIYQIKKKNVGKSSTSHSIQSSSDRMLGRPEDTQIPGPNNFRHRRLSSWSFIAIAAIADNLNFGVEEQRAIILFLFFQLGGVLLLLTGLVGLAAARRRVTAAAAAAAGRWRVTAAAAAAAAAAGGRWRVTAWAELSAVIVVIVILWFNIAWVDEFEIGGIRCDSGHCSCF